MLTLRNLLSVFDGIRVWIEHNTSVVIQFRSDSHQKHPVVWRNHLIPVIMRQIHVCMMEFCICQTRSEREHCCLWCGGLFHWSLFLICHVSRHHTSIGELEWVGNSHCGCGRSGIMGL